MSLVFHWMVGFIVGVCGAYECTTIQALYLWLANETKHTHTHTPYKMMAFSLVIKLFEIFVDERRCNQQIIDYMLTILRLSIFSHSIKTCWRQNTHTHTYSILQAFYDDNEVYFLRCGKSHRKNEYDWYERSQDEKSARTKSEQNVLPTMTKATTTAHLKTPKTRKNK